MDAGVAIVRLRSRKQRARLLLDAFTNNVNDGNQHD